MKKILSFISWNGFSNYLSKPLLYPLKSSSTIPLSNNSTKRNDISAIIFRLPYTRIVHKQLLKRCFEKYERFLNSNFKFRVLYGTKKMPFYCNIKDRVSHTQRSHVIYTIKCPGCSGCYISKTERCLITRINEQGRKGGCLNSSLNMNCLKIVFACIPYSSQLNKDENDISLNSDVFTR